VKVNFYLRIIIYTAAMKLPHFRARIQPLASPELRPRFHFCIVKDNMTTFSSRFSFTFRYWYPVAASAV
jgi:hypothetical protein